MSDESDPSPALPLEARSVSWVSSANGLNASRPALDAGWVIARTWLPFENPPLDGQADLVLWLERTRFLEQDLTFLLRLEHHQFWSQMIYDPQLRTLMGGLLQNLPRHFDLDARKIANHPEVHSLMSEVLRLTFLVMVRLSTHKESSAHFMSPAFFGQTIYGHFLIDIPRLMDICVLFRPCNPAIVDKMVANVFKRQPKYLADLRSSVVTVVKALQTVVNQVEVQTTYYNCDDPQKLLALQDVVVYACDIVLSIEGLTLACPLTSQAFYDGQFLTALSPFYQQVLVGTLRFVSHQTAAGYIPTDLNDELVSRLQMCRLASVNLFRRIVMHACIEPIFESDRKDELAESFLQIATECLSDGALLADYAKSYNLEDDFHIFDQAGADLDPMRVSFILEGVQSVLNEFSEQIQRKLTQELAPKPTLLSGARPKTKTGSKPVEPEPEKHAVADIDEAEVALVFRISQIKDLFPDFGDGFIEECLQYFDQDPEKVINALLEENIPPHLIEVDRQKSRNLKPTPSLSTSGQPRRNIHDGDEFDINVRDTIDMSKVQIGKKRLVKNAGNALLDDKTELQGLKDMYSKLSIVTEDIVVGGEYDTNYDDEYDDTYDDNAIGQTEPDAQDELTERRPFVLPRALGGGHITYSKGNPNDQDEDESDGDGDEKDEFLRNPAEIREANERKRQERQAHKMRSKGNPNPNPPSRDVVGKAKGQGQDKSVLINRARKNANKGKHHRAMADRKYNKA
ncbi:hypothetical protein TCAL_00737 [Tigriopus californicus]|uniref:CUE domain-containing protein n=1 Tax=Tigriopus californicus TaxID=6832 RepID=A0A553PAF8_TIGCA|nr:activating signal cointegrator 1 complex subunit 2-like [Tigriopus californicus]TRY74672.1 hypothetical protein TCAL_00737 [Tigriopus californicus]|eukprot:TCALIF_00737-PA protein Name:"Similar to ASCC2 Activating signal cointegrator 1 complex subunit 2 (Homo sapiens)" AED:0.26 eAED:0.26 QI:0/-1/0/1/-1/1/1/0/740